jgi:hypothetical protein
MLGTLQQLDLQSGDLRYADAAEETVLPAWRSAAGTAQPGAADQPRLDAFARVTVEALLRHAGALRYRDGDRAVQVRAALSGDPGTAVQPAGATPAAVVDGAWRWRQQDPDRFARARGRVNDLALAWCAGARLDGGEP